MRIAQDQPRCPPVRIRDPRQGNTIQLILGVVEATVAILEGIVNIILNYSKKGAPHPTESEYR